MVYGNTPVSTESLEALARNRLPFELVSIQRRFRLEYDWHLRSRDAACGELQLLIIGWPACLIKWATRLSPPLFVYTRRLYRALDISCVASVINVQRRPRRLRICLCEKEANLDNVIANEAYLRLFRPLISSRASATLTGHRYRANTNGDACDEAIYDAWYLDIKAYQSHQ